MIAETVADITPEWLSAALSKDGSEITVTPVSAQRIGTGQMGTTHRLSIECEQGPRRLVAKLAAEDPANRLANCYGYQQEVKFYQHLVSTVAVRTPACSYAAISDDGTIFTLLLEDVSPAVPGVQANGCSVGEAHVALHNLAGLHAPRWNDPTLHDFDLLDYTANEGAAAVFMGSYQAEATEKFLNFFKDRLSPDDAATLRDAARVTTKWLTSRTTPFALLHGDYRLDNLMFHPNGSEVIALDWQSLLVGPATRDVAYFLGTSLNTQDRRANEKDLVRAYHAELVSQGITDYEAGQCFEDYKFAQLWAPLITTVGSMNASGQPGSETDEMFLAMARRSCAAIRDHHSLDLVP